MKDSQPKTVGRLHVNLIELNELEADIGRIFADFEGEEAKRKLQQIMNNLNYMKAMVRAQNYLARTGAIKLVDARS